MPGKKLSPFATIMLIMIAIIAVCMYYPGVISFLLVVAALLLASVLLLLHLILAWRSLTVTRRLGIVLSIVVWMGFFYGLVYANGFTFTSLFG